ncbi:MAG: hypothetical protein ACI4SK_04110 [Christensenellales bacterium]
MGGKTYPYHNRIIQRIKNGELIDVRKGEGEFCLVFVFSTFPYLRPIRKTALYRYEKIFSEKGIDPTEFFGKKSPD